MKPGKLTALTDLSFPVSLTCISLKLQMLVHPHLHLEKKKRNATTFLSLTHSQTLFSFPNLFGDSLVFSKQGSYTSLSYLKKKRRNMAIQQGMIIVTLLYKLMVSPHRNWCDNTNYSYN